MMASTSFLVAMVVSPGVVIAIGEPAEKIELVPVPENGDVNYYRDENGTHYVPKRALEDIVLEKK